MKKLISVLLICSMLLLPTVSFAEVGLFFADNTAKSLLSTLEYERQSVWFLKQSLEYCDNNSTLLQQSLDLAVRRSSMQDNDIKLLTSSVKDLQKEYDLCDAKLKKCIESRPSRSTWFGVGFGSALLMVLLGGFLLN